MNVSELTLETILEASTFEELFSHDPLDGEHLELMFELQEKARMLGVKMKFDALYNARKAKFKQEKKDHKIIEMKEYRERKKNMQALAMTEFSHSKYPELYCGQWTANENGIRSFGMFGEIIACFHPIMPVMRLYNMETSREKMVVAFKKAGRWSEQIFDKSTLLSANKVINAMVDYGILLSSENAKYLVRYFAEVEALNMDTIPTQRSTSKMGWMDEYERFMPFCGNDIVFDSESSFKTLYKAISAHGKEARYIDFLRHIRQAARKEPMMCVAASLASVLVRPCGSLPFIFHLYGEAGKGKTICLMLASSIWGSPDDNGFLADPKSTKTAFELRLNFLNNLPFVCDDTAQMKKFITNQRHGDFSDFIYLLCSGKGNERSNVNLGLNTITTWSNASITSGEKPLTSEVSQGGELLRVVEMQTSEGDIFKNSRGVADFLRQHYGFLGVAFIKAVQEIGISETKRIYSEFIEKIHEMDKHNEKEGKQINSLALMLTADAIFTDHVMQDGVYLDINYCFDLIKSNRQMSDNERAYEFVLNEIAMHQKKFAVGHVEPDQRWGYFKDEYVLINPNVFSGMAERGNFNKRMFIEWAIGKGIAKANSVKGKQRLDLRVNDSGIKGAFVAIKRENPYAEPDSEIFETVEDEQLPF